MQVQSINNAPSFGALKITPEAKALIEREAEGATKIKKYTKELENSRWDLSIKTFCKDDIYSHFGDKREGCVIPCHLKDNFVMVYSHEVGGDNEDDIIDCLKFSSAERAKEVYNKLNDYFLAKKPNGDYGKTPLQHLDWDVYAMKAFTEAEIVPQKNSPWAHFLRRNDSPRLSINEPAVEKNAEKKPSFSQRLRNTWNALLGK